jgi:transcriptional repressor NF-X1
MQECFCGRHSVTRRCVETNYNKGWSCGEVCGELMACGEHQCARPCHSDVCGDCRTSVAALCYCGKVEKHMPCHNRDEPIDSFYHGSQGVEAGREVGPFEGCFDCGGECGRLFDCGEHRCRKKCHPQDEAAAHCPLSPDVMLSCPCGKTLLSDLGNGHRETCTDPIPGCNSTCDKTLPCGHQCPEKCHNGECPPCARLVDVLCRCGRPFSQELCLDVGPEPPVCDRTCQVQMYGCLVYP